MKKILLLIPILFLLTGCLNMTHEQMLDKKDECKELGLGWEYQNDEYGDWIACTNREKEE